MSTHGTADHRGISLVTKSSRQRLSAFRNLGLEAASPDQVPAGKFGRIFDGLPIYEPTNEGIRQLAETMRDDDAVSGDSTIPLGFAFLGQFIDHDVTFDPVSRLDERLDPDAVRNFRTPSLDLDSVYGDGPDASRHLYDTHGKDPESEHRLPFRLLTNTEKRDFDLPRNHQGTALIGDPRNDENLLISQLHRAILGFHNEVVKHIELASGGNPPANKDLFEEARNTVTLHYHWIILNEFLPLIVGPSLTNDIIVNGRKFFRWEERSDRPFIPVEFGGAAYRFGHTLIRSSYNLNDTTQGIELFKLPFFGTCPLGDCGDEVGPSQAYQLDWNYFLELDDSTKLQFCRRIDAKIAGPLFELPFIHRRQDAPQSLPERNMRRARTLKLPSGQDVAAAMGVDVLSNEDLGIAAIDGLGDKAPLWFYILKESALVGDPGGAHLGPVGGRIVAETIIGMIDIVRDTILDSEGDRNNWTPTLPDRFGNVGTFTLADLVSFRASAAR